MKWKCMHCRKVISGIGLDGAGWRCSAVLGQYVCKECHRTTEHALLHALSGDPEGSEIASFIMRGGIE